MARSRRLFRRHRHHEESALAIILPRIVMVGLLCLILYYLLHKTSQHLKRL